MIPGVVASQSATLKTANPTMGTPYYTTSWRVGITNADSASVALYADYNTNPPTTLRNAALASGATYAYNTGLTIGGFTVYAKAQASGKDASDVVSVYVS